jgi:tRNA (cmo5U34)-methyltransferase
MPASMHPSTVDGWDPRTYPAFTAAIGPAYEELHDAVLDAARDHPATSILDLGIGTGEAARRLLSVHEGATVVGVDANQAMLDAAAAALAPERATLVRRRLEEPLPPGPFDLVVSVLAIHHLNGPGKADLFARIRDVLAPNGWFVLGDSMRDPHATEHRQSTVQRLSRSLRNNGVAGTTGKVIRRLRPGAHVDYDDPDLLVDQVAWMTSAGLRAEVTWEKHQCAVVRAQLSRAAALTTPSLRAPTRGVAASPASNAA